MSHKTSSYSKHDLFVLTTPKTVNGEPLNGMYYRFEWVDGETIAPISKKDANKVARIRGVGIVPWEESKAYKRLVTQEVKEVQESTSGIFEALKKTAGVKDSPEKRS